MMVNVIMSLIFAALLFVEVNNVLLDIYIPSGDQDQDHAYETNVRIISSFAAGIGFILAILAGHYAWNWFFVFMMVLIAVAQLLCHESIAWYLAIAVAVLQIVASIGGFITAVSAGDMGGWLILFRGCLFWPLIELVAVWFVSNISAALDERKREQED